MTDVTVVEVLSTSEPDLVEVQVLHGPAGPPGPEGPQGPVGPPGQSAEGALDLSTKSPLLDWVGKRALGVGTSILQQGGKIDSYLTTATTRLRASFLNMGWSGSHAVYNVLGDPASMDTIKALSMTEDDRQAGIALYGVGSAYGTSVDGITPPQQMTCDYRIDLQYQTTPFDVVFFDHNHNDMHKVKGPATFETIPILSIVKGATTQITLTSIGTIVVGNGIALDIVGINELNHAAVRVQAVAGNTITININSSAFAGTFGSGNCIKYDRNTTRGSFYFLWHRIRRAAFLAGVADPIIIYSGAPSEYTGGDFEPDVRTVNETIREIADELGCAFFDICTRYKITSEWNRVYFEDSIHPLEPHQREPLADMWAEWMFGGVIKMTDESNFVPAPFHAAGTSVSYTDQAPVVYSRLAGGAGTPDFLLGPAAVVLSEDFSGGLGTWTSNGVAPVIEAAPWGSGSAIKCAVNNSTGNPSSYLSRSIALDRARIVEFDFWLPDVSGLATYDTAIVDLCALRSSSGYYLFGLKVTTTKVQLQNRYFQTPGANLITLTPVARTDTILADTKYRIRYEMHNGSTADKPGRLLVYLDDVLVAGPYALTDHEQTPVASIRIGPQGSNTNLPVVVYIGNLTVSERPVDSIETRVTGPLNGIDFVGGWAVGASGGVETPLTALSLAEAVAAPAAIAGASQFYLPAATGPLTVKTAIGGIRTMFDTGLIGSWTPTFSFATPGDSVITHTAQNGKYLKLGSFVLIMLDIQFNTNAYTTAAGAAGITGIPYTTPSVIPGTLSIAYMNNVTFGAALLGCTVQLATSTLRIKVTTSNATNTDAGITQFPPSKTGIRIIASGMYWTNV